MHSVCPRDAETYRGEAGDIFYRSAKYDGLRALRQFSGEKADAEGNDRGVEEVVEEAADHRDDEVGRGGGTVAAGNGLHIGHGVRRGAHAETNEAGGP